MEIRDATTLLVRAREKCLEIQERATNDFGRVLDLEKQLHDVRMDMDAQRDKAKADSITANKEVEAARADTERLTADAGLLLDLQQQLQIKSTELITARAAVNALEVARENERVAILSERESLASLASAFSALKEQKEQQQQQQQQQDIQRQPPDHNNNNNSSNNNSNNNSSNSNGRIATAERAGDPEGFRPEGGQIQIHPTTPTGASGVISAATTIDLKKENMALGVEERIYIRDLQDVNTALQAEMADLRNDYKSQITSYAAVKATNDTLAAERTAQAALLQQLQAAQADAQISLPALHAKVAHLSADAAAWRSTGEAANQERGRMEAEVVELRSQVVVNSPRKIHERLNNQVKGLSDAKSRHLLQIEALELRGQKQDQNIEENRLEIQELLMEGKKREQEKKLLGEDLNHFKELSTDQEKLLATKEQSLSSLRDRILRAVDEEGARGEARVKVITTQKLELEQEVMKLREVLVVHKARVHGMESVRAEMDAERAEREAQMLSVRNALKGKELALEASQHSCQDKHAALARQEQLLLQEQEQHRTFREKFEKADADRARFQGKSSALAAELVHVKSSLLEKQTLFTSLTNKLEELDVAHSHQTEQLQQALVDGRGRGHQVVQLQADEKKKELEIQRLELALSSEKKKFEQHKRDSHGQHESDKKSFKQALGVEKEKLELLQGLYDEAQARLREYMRNLKHAAEKEQTLQEQLLRVQQDADRVLDEKTKQHQLRVKGLEELLADARTVTDGAKSDQSNLKQELETALQNVQGGKNELKSCVTRHAADLAEKSRKYNTEKAASLRTHTAALAAVQADHENALAATVKSRSSKEADSERLYDERHQSAREVHVKEVEALRVRISDEAAAHAVQLDEQKALRVEAREALGTAKAASAFELEGLRRQLYESETGRKMAQTSLKTRQKELVLLQEEVDSFPGTVRERVQNIRSSLQQQLAEQSQLALEREAQIQTDRERLQTRVQQLERLSESAGAEADGVMREMKIALEDAHRELDSIHLVHGTLVSERAAEKEKAKNVLRELSVRYDY
mgnify:CR=1 FL=1